MRACPHESRRYHFSLVQRANTPWHIHKTIGAYWPNAASASAVLYPRQSAGLAGLRRRYRSTAALSSFAPRSFSICRIRSRVKPRRLLVSTKSSGATLKRS